MTFAKVFRQRGDSVDIVTGHLGVLLTKGACFLFLRCCLVCSPQ